MTASAELARHAQGADIGYQIPQRILEGPQRRARILKISALRGYVDARRTLSLDGSVSERTLAIKDARELATQRGGVRGMVARTILFNSEPLQPKELTSFVK